VRGKADHGEQRVGAGAGLGLRQAEEAEGDVGAGGQMGKEREILEDEPHPALLGGDEHPGGIDDFAVDRHFAGFRPLDAGGAEQADDLARPDLERDAIDDRAAGEGLGDGAQRQDGGVHGGGRYLRDNRKSSALGVVVGRRGGQQLGDVGLVERVLVRTEDVGGAGDDEAGRHRGVEKARGLQLIHARQIRHPVETEMLEEGLGGAVGDRASRGAAAAAQPDPADLQEEVERALGDADAPDLLDRISSISARVTGW